MALCVEKLKFTSQDHSVTQDLLGDLKNLISGTREDLQDQLDELQRISTADASLREVLLEDQAQLQSSLDSIAQAQQVADTTRPKVVIEHNRAGQGSRAIFGTDTSQPGFSLTVANNEAGVGAVYSAGVHSPQTLQALLQNSRTPDLALVLQVLQSQSPGIRNEAVQSALNNISVERNREVTDIPGRSLLTGLDNLDSMGGRQVADSVSLMPANAGNDSRVFERLRG